MLKNYLKIALRNIAKNKLYSFINIAGLSLGIAGSLIILVYVSNQLSYESMHKNADKIVRVSVGFGKGMKLAGAMSGIGPAAVDEIPQVKASIRFRKDADAKVKAGDKEFSEENFFFADSNVFSVFTFPFLEGNPNTALNNPNSIVISERIAKKYFGSENAIGKELTYNNKYHFTVTGIIKNVPPNTYLRCDFIAPYAKAIEIFNINQPWMSWGADFTFRYLRNNIPSGELEKKLDKLLLEHTNEGFAKLVNIFVLPLRDIYLKSDMMGEWGPAGSMQSIYIFTTISFLLLIIACLNFINLTTARSLRRSKEAGMRKVLGANRFGLIKQFWGESIIITLFAVVISVIIYELLNPLLFKYFNVNINELNLLNTNFLFILIGIIVFVSLFAGMYPAIFLSKYKPVDSLKGIKTPGSSASGLRKVLVVLQFSISIFLLIGTAAIYKQINYMLNSDPGFNKKNVLVVNFPVTSRGAVDKYAVMKNEFLSVPGVTDVSGVYSLPGVNNKEQQTFKIKGVTYKKAPVLQADGVDYNFIQTMGLKISEGRNFSEKLKTDAANSIIINEAAVKKLGLKNPVGTQVYLPQGKGEHLVTIIGVVKDFHITSFRNLIEPMFLYINPERFYNVAVKINSSDTKQIIASLQNKFKALFPAKLFNCETLSEKYGSMYNSEERNGTLILIFTVLSIIVASMGLFGLSAFSTEVRIKEIGIRKVLGADVFNISFLLSKDFSKWVLIANVIAWPAAYFVISKWLEDFAYKTDIGVIIFIASGAAAFIIALATISIQAIKAASSNPVKALRHE